VSAKISSLLQSLQTLHSRRHQTSVSTKWWTGYTALRVSKRSFDTYHCMSIWYFHTQLASCNLVLWVTVHGWGCREVHNIAGRA